MRLVVGAEGMGGPRRPAESDGDAFHTAREAVEGAVRMHQHALRDARRASRRAALAEAHDRRAPVCAHPRDCCARRPRGRPAVARLQPGQVAG